jgi:prophage tail gpP-like protein
VIKLLVNGKQYAGWKSARVTRGIETVSGTFELSYTDRWTGQAKPWAIYEEDECTVSLDEQIVITGHVDKREVSFNESDHSLSVSGRDRTGALVDCSASLKKWEFHSTPLLTLAKELCKPLGVPVVLAANVKPAKPPEKTTIDPGDSAFDALEKACRIAGVLPVSDGLGGLMLMRPGSTRTTTALTEGQNIKSASATFDATGRFHTYKVLGQHKGSDKLNGAQAAHVAGTATDANVRRSERTHIVRPEGNVTPEQAKRRAQWEATTRAVRGDVVTVVVQGWTQSDGTLWPINAIVPVLSPTLGIFGNMLITQTVFSVDANSGTLTQLSLRRPDAFDPEPVVSKDKTELWKEIARGV